MIAQMVFNKINTVAGNVGGCLIYLLLFFAFNSVYASDTVNSVTTADRDKNILVIDSINYGEDITEGNIGQLLEELKFYHKGLSFSGFHIDSVAEDKVAQQQERLKAFLQRFSNIYFDAIIVKGDNALQAVYSLPKDIFSGAPLVYYDVSEIKSGAYINSTGILNENLIPENIAFMKEFFPDIEHVAVITDNSFHGRLHHNKIKEILNNDVRVSAIYINGSTLTEQKIIEFISTLPPRTGIFIDSYTLGINGRYSENFLKTILNNSKFPVFSDKAKIIKAGALGGVVQDLHDVTQVIAKLIVPDILLYPEHVQTIKVELSSNKFLVNWRTLQRYDGRYQSNGRKITYFGKSDNIIERNNTSNSGLDIVFKSKPPLIWQNSHGNIQGAFADIWRLWAQQSGIQINFTPNSESLANYQHSGRFIRVAAGESIILPQNNYNKFEQFTPLMQTNASIFQRSEIALKKNWNEYRNSRIAIESNDSFKKFITAKIPGVTLVLYADSEALFADIGTGKFDAFFMEDIVAETLLHERGYEQQLMKNTFCTSRVSITPVLLDNREAVLDSGIIQRINQGFKRISFAAESGIINSYNKTEAPLYPVFSAEEKQWLAKNKIIRIGCVGETRTLQSQEGDTVVGIIPDILRIIFNKIGIEYKFVPLTVNSSEFDTLVAGDIDILSYSDSQDNFGMLYSAPYLRQPVVLITRSQQYMLGDGKSIIVVPSNYSRYYYFLKRKYKDQVVLLVSSPGAAISMVSDKIADIAVISSIDAQNFSSEIRYANMEKSLLRSMLIDFNLTLIDNSQNHILLDIINKGIITVSEKSVDNVIQRYRTVPEHVPSLYNLIVLVGPWVLLFGVILLALWGYITKKALIRLHYSESSLRTEKAWLDAMMHSLGEGVIATDIQGRVVQINYVAECLLNCSEAKAIGRSTGNLYKLYNTLNKKLETDPVHKVLEKKAVVEFQHNTLLINQAQEEIPVIATFAPIVDKAEDNLLGVVLVFKDISAEYIYRRQLNQAKTILSNAIKLAGVAYFAYDLEHNKVIVNDGRQETYLYVEDNFSLKHLFDNIVVEDFNEVQRLWYSLLRGEIADFHFSYRSKVNELIKYNKIDLRSEVDPDGKLIRAFGVKLDVTDIVLAENVYRERLEQAYDMARLVYYEYNPINNIITGNSKLFTLFMLDANDSEFITIDDILTFVLKEDRMSIKEALSQINEKKLQRFEHELRIERKSFRRIVKIFLTNKFSDKGEWVASTGCVLDITELNYVQKELETSEEQKRLILGSIKEAVVYLNRDLSILWANESTYKVFDCAEILPLSEQHNYIVYGTSKPSMLSNTVGVMRGISEELIESLNYNNRELLVSLNPIHNESGSVTHIVKTFSDISEFKEIQENLKEAYRREETANRAKSIFLSTITHEIRTPLNAIIGFSGLLQYEKLDNKSASYANSIHTAATGLLSLINNVLDLSRIEANKLSLSLQPVNLYDLLEEINIIFEVRAQTKGLKLLLTMQDSIPFLILDKDRLRQVLINIIGNAVKFTNSGSVTVSSEFIKNIQGAAGELIITVSDTGIGIPAEDQSRMFESFEQHENSSSRRYEGTGLGLSISKRLVELMNGKILLTSEVGRGSEFKIVLSNIEYTVDNITDEAKRERHIQCYNQQNVLLISDNQSDITLIDDMLSKMNLNIETTALDTRASELLVQTKFSLIIAGVFSSVRQDVSQRRELLTKAGELKIPVLALTGYSEPDDYFDTSEYDRVIIKPITFEMFSDIMGCYFESMGCILIPDSSQNQGSQFDITKLNPAIVREILQRFSADFDSMLHGVVITEAQKTAREFVVFAENTGDQAIINIAKNFEQYVATYKLPDIIYVVREFLTYKE